MIRLADRIAHALIEDGTTWIVWGDGIIVDACGGHTRLRNSHPLNVMKAGLDSCARAPDLFEPARIRAMDSRGRDRVVRGFKLIGKPRGDVR